MGEQATKLGLSMLRASPRPPAEWGGGYFAEVVDLVSAGNGGALRALVGEILGDCGWRLWQGLELALTGARSPRTAELIAGAISGLALFTKSSLPDSQGVIQVPYCSDVLAGLAGSTINRAAAEDGYELRLPLVVAAGLDQLLGNSGRAEDLPARIVASAGGILGLEGIGAARIDGQGLQTISSALEGLRARFARVREAQARVDVNIGYAL